LAKVEKKGGGMSIKTDSGSPGLMLFLCEQTFQACCAIGRGFVSEIDMANRRDVRLALR
jgi:hypothetical protein